jgi:hypothetical protein
VELIVALTISAIVIAGAGMLLISGSNLLAHQANRAEQESITDATVEYIKERMLYAQSVEIVTSPTVPGGVSDAAVLYVGSSPTQTATQGYLYFMRNGDTSPINAFGDAFYMRSKISLDYSVVVPNDMANTDQSKYFKVTVHIFINDIEQYQATKTFKLINSAATDEPLSNEQVIGQNEPFYLLIK